MRSITVVNVEYLIRFRDGTGAIWDSATIGLIVSFMILILGICYSKFLEEQEFGIRFGKQCK